MKVKKSIKKAQNSILGGIKKSSADSTRDVRIAQGFYYPLKEPGGDLMPTPKFYDYQRKGKKMENEPVPRPVVMKPKPKSGAVKQGMLSENPKTGEVKKKMGGKVKSSSLKPVPPAKKKSLGKLPKAVRNKMGFQKQGGKNKKMMGGGKCKYGC